MSKKTYKRVIAGSVGAVVASTSMPITPLVMAEETTVSDTTVTPADTTTTEATTQTTVAEATISTTLPAEVAGNGTTTPNTGLNGEVPVVSNTTNVATTETAPLVARFQLESKDGSVATETETTLQLFSNDGSELVGTIEKNGNEIRFVSTSAFDESATFTYKVTTPGYEELNGGPISVATLKSAPLSLQLVKKEVPKGAGVVFTSTDSEYTIKTEDIIFKDKNGTVLNIPLVAGEATKFDFSSLEEGDIVRYEILAENYKKNTGNFTISSSDMEIPFDLEPINEINEDASLINKVYGSEDFSIVDKLNLPVDYDGKISYSVESGTEFISVDSSGVVKILSPGSATLKIEASRTDNFEAIDVVIPIEVTQKNLGQLELSMINWKESTLTKSYDGNDDFEVEGILNSNSGLVSSDSIIVKAKVKTSSINAGEYESTIESISFSGDTEKYQYLTDNLMVGPDVTIEKKDVSVSLKNITVAYGSDDWQSIVDGKNPFNLAELVSLPSDLSETVENDISALELDDYLNVSVSKDDYKVGDFNDVVTLSKNNKEATNFNFTIAVPQSNLIVAKDTGDSSHLWSNVELDTAKSKDIYIDGNDVYVKPGGNITFALKDTSVYDTLNVKSTNLDGDDYSTNLSIPDSSLSKDIVGSFYLSHSESADTRTAESAIPANYKVDADAPTVEFLGGSKIFASIFNVGTTEFSNVNDALEFSKANNDKGYVVTLGTEDNGSGLKSLKYSLVRVTSDEDAKAKVRSAVTSDDTNWTSVENNAISVDGIDEGYYIVIVKATDNVGNSSVYASNGMVIDVTNPTIMVSGLEDAANLNFEPISYTVNLLDPISNGVATGIAKVDVVAKSNGEKIYSSEENTNSFSLTMQDLYGVDDIDNFSEFELAKLSKQFTGKIDIDSNDVTIEIIAYDASGNKVSSNEYSGIKIDKTGAKVEANYSGPAVKNGKYVSGSRTLTVDFTDKNFDESNAIVTVSVNGESKNYTIEQIRNGEAQGVQLVTDRTDSEENTLETRYTTNRVNTYVFKIGKATDSNATYSIDISYSKNEQIYNADFSNDDANGKFVVDNMNPETSIFFTSNSELLTVSTDSTNPTYKNNSVSAGLVVKEANFDPKDVVVHITSKNGDGAANSRYSLDYDALSTVGSWSSNGDTHTFKLNDFEGDSNYSISFEYTDLAGNKSQTDTYYLTIDKTAPSGSVVVNGSSEYTNISSSVSFAHVSNSSVQVGQTSKDDISGIASVKYHLYHPNVDAKGEITVPSGSELETLSWSNWDNNLSIEPNQQVVVYQRIEDKAGNVTYVNTGKVILVDSVAPSVPNIEINTPSVNNIYSGDVSATINVEDIVEGGTYSGLNTVTVEVLNGDVVTQSQTFNVGTIEDRNRTFETGFTIDAQRNNSNYVTIRVTAVDLAGNVSTSNRQLMIDTTAPRIEVVWDTSDAKNGRYYNQNRTATIRVYERNFDPSLVNISINGGNASISGWTIGDAAGSSDENVNVATITFSEDGDYTFSIDVTDKAGNKADFSHTELFTIDKTIPNISVSWDKELVNGRYVAGTRTATITVTEHNFDAAGLTADIKAMLENQGISTPGVSGWISNGDVHVATITFANDGDYSFALNFEDLAGNKADSYNENEFTVDMTDPDIVFENIEDGSSNRGEVRPIVQFSDRNFDKNKISLTLKGYRHAEVNVTGSFVEDGNGGRIVLDDFPHELETDDVYTLTAQATDLAGNDVTKSITFSVNRFGSNYYFSENTEKYLDTYYHNKEQDIVIHEVNTDSLKVNDITIVRDGVSIKLDKDDYFIRDISSNGWKEYVYTIKAENFAKEGRYEITIDSEDMAGNVQSNKIKEKPASFVIDKTDPSAVITGVENGEIYNAIEREVTVVSTDNVLVEKVELILDGEVVEKMSSEELLASNGSFTHKLSDSKKWQVLQVKTTDAAGNKYTSKEVRVLITPDVTTRAVNNLWFKVLGGGVAVLSAGLLLFLFGKRRKEEQSDLG